MKILMFLLFLAVMVTSMFLGALQISSAIRFFKREKYFMFGLDVISAIMFISIIIKTLFVRWY